MNKIVSINVPLEIFEKPIIRNKMEKVLYDNKKEYCMRYSKIAKYVIDNFDDKFNFDEVKKNFKIRFEEHLLKKAIENMLYCNKGESYNITKHILKLINNEECKKAIEGEVMIDAFSLIFTNMRNIRKLEEHFL